MARLAAWVALATVAAGVVGCGPAKELPDEVIKHADPGEKQIVVPAASDPKAKDYVTKAVNAFTAGKPELVAKGKVSRLVLKGTMLAPVENQAVPVDTTRTVAAVVPDRFFGVNDQLFQGRQSTVTAWLHRPHLTIMTGLEEFSPPNRAEAERNLVADTYGQHWIALLVPLTEPKAIVFDLQSTSVTSPQTGEPQAVQQLKLAIPTFSPFQLSFDAKTDLLVRVEYTLTEQGARRRKQWAVLEHKAGPDGQMLPSKIELRHDGQVVEQWTAEKWEFPAKIDDAEFTPPKK